MPIISAEDTTYTVLVRVSVAAPHQDELVRLSTGMLDVFERQPGFVSCSVLRALDGGEVLTYLQWESQEHHEACQSNPEVAAHGQEFMAFLHAKNGHLEVRSYEVVVTSESAPEPGGEEEWA